jgi:glycerol-3-phosphate dehydrogenase
MEDGLYDVLVIGGGIVGAGIARDAALRGLRVLLLEQNDFASGTSSRTSRLLHGGLRYLAQGKVKMVWQASREKVVLGKIAPHLTEALPFIFPTNNRGTWEKWKLSLGVKIYDFLCRGQNFGKSKTLTREEVIGMVPGIREAHLNGGVRYFDALTYDSRLVIDTLRSAEAHGAELMSQTRFLRTETSDGIWTTQTETNGQQNSLKFKSKIIVNASGPWSGRLRRSRVKIRPTKGAHLVIKKDRLNMSEALVMPQENRILFLIPWGERIILGTTDTDYQGSLNKVVCEDFDRDYILKVVNKYFPEAALEPKDILSSYAGLRPLLHEGSKGPSDISRKHRIKMSAPGWIDVSGGKLTTYRLIAEETLNLCRKHLRASWPECKTAKEPLLTEEQLKSGSSGIIPPTVSKELVEHYCKNEWASHVEDVMLRRTGWKHYLENHEEVAKDVLNWMSEYHNWSSEEKEKEWKAYCIL